MNHGILLVMLLSQGALPDAHAGPGGFFRSVKRLKVRKAPGGAKPGGRLAGLVVVERASLGLEGLGPEVGQHASFLARENGSLRVVRRVGGVLEEAPGLPEAGAVVLDLTAAVDPEVLDELVDREVFVLDEDGGLRRVHHDGERFVLDGRDLLEVAAAFGEPETWGVVPLVVAGSGTVGLIGLSVVGARRSRARREHDEEQRSKPQHRFFCERCLRQYEENHGDCPSCPEEPLLDLADPEVVRMLQKFDEQAWRTRLGQVTAVCSLLCSPLLLTGLFVGAFALPVFGFGVAALSAVVYPIVAITPRTPARLRQA